MTFIDVIVAIFNDNGYYRSLSAWYLDSELSTCFTYFCRPLLDKCGYLYLYFDPL